jgi:hypothetical protein
MPRQERLDFKNAIHYVRVRGRDGLKLFFDARDLGRFPFATRHDAPNVHKFELILADVCAECGALLHGYCVEPNSAILVLRTAGAPLQALMRRLGGRYSISRRVTGLGRGEAVYGARYDSKIVAPIYLAHAVRRAHRSPIVGGLCKRRMDYPFSSDRAYSGETAPLPVAMLDVKRALERRGHFGLQGYQKFMDQNETPYVANLLSHGAPLDSRIAGDNVFVQSARYSAAHPGTPPNREQFIAGVARLLNKRPADIESATRVGALGRALVAWHAVRSGAATHSEVGRWFCVTGAALKRAIRHYRGVRRDLFDLAVLPGLDFGAAG